MSRLRVGIVGLGNIACKAWLPVLSDARDWILAGAFSPDLYKAETICAAYRIPCFRSLSDLAEVCDAVFVHSAIHSHFHVVSALLNYGVDVLVDKPLAETLEQAEKRVALANRKKRILMVGFNRRFAPLYQILKSEMTTASSLLVDKHRYQGRGAVPYPVG